MNNEQIALLVNSLTGSSSQQNKNSAKAGKDIVNHHVVIVRPLDTTDPPKGFDPKNFYSIGLEESEGALGDQVRLYNKAIFEDTHSLIYTKIDELVKKHDSDMEKVATAINTPGVISKRGGINGSMLVYENIAPYNPVGNDGNVLTDPNTGDPRVATKVVTFALAGESEHAMKRNALRGLQWVDEADPEAVDASAKDLLENKEETKKTP